MTLTPTADTICVCGHWFEEHAEDSCGGCDASGLDLAAIEHPFEHDAEQSTPAAIADRGGDPDAWPQRVKDAIKALPAYEIHDPVLGMDVYDPLAVQRSDVLAIVDREAAQVRHVVPAGEGHRTELDAGCWCQPTIEEVPPNGRIFVHRRTAA